MTGLIETFIVIALFLLALILFFTEAFPAELVALMVMTLLMITQIVTPEEGLSGFSNPATITILALFVISAGVYRTGIVTALARRLSFLTGKSEVRALLLLVVVVGPVSAFINNTAAVAILIPLVMTLAKESRTSPSKLLMPLSFISMLAGTITLVGTSTNILVAALYREETGRALGMFEFAEVGVIVFIAGTIYLLAVGRFLIPARIRVGEASEDALLRDFITEVKIRPESPLVGKTLADYRAKQRHRVDAIRLLRRGQAFDQPLRDIPLEEGDVLVLRAPRDRLTSLEKDAKVEILAGVKQEDVGAGEPGRIVEVVVSPNSSLVRRTLSEADFADEFGVKILGLRQHGPALFKRLGSTRLNFGDTLLCLASPGAVMRLRQDPDFIIGDEQSAQEERPEKMVVALGILAGVIGGATLGLAPILVLALAGAVLMVLLRVLRPEDLWTSVRWDVIFLLAGLIPLGIAFQRVGIAASVGSFVANLSLTLPDIGVIMLFYLASTLLTAVLSNAATAILLVPIAFATASALGGDPLPLVLSVMFAASASFITPVGYQTNLMVYGPGEYRFADFTKVGLPLTAILLVVTSYALSMTFPLR